MQRMEHEFGAHRFCFGIKGPFWSHGQHCGLQCSFDVSVRARMAAERLMLLVLGVNTPYLKIWMITTRVGLVGSSGLRIDAHRINR